MVLREEDYLDDKYIRPQRQGLRFLVEWAKLNFHHFGKHELWNSLDYRIIVSFSPPLIKIFLQLLKQNGPNLAPD